MSFHKFVHLRILSHITCVHLCYINFINKPSKTPWEGIGISSYLLINFWYTRIQANKSGIKALTVNRVGDMFLSVGFFAIFWVFGNVDYATVFSIAPFINETAITIIGLLLLLGAMAKSAQLGLHTWLPDAMEGWFKLSISVLLGYICYTYYFVIDNS